MKKSNLYVALVYLLVGAGCFIALSLTDTMFGSLLAGLGGAGIGGGLVMIAKYTYWSNPRKKDAYEEKLAEEEINLQDERNVKLRDKSGRYAYIITMLFLVISMMAIPIVDKFIVINTIFMLIYVGGLLAGMYIIGILIYQNLNKKY
jgi:hypothetical protein